MRPNRDTNNNSRKEIAMATMTSQQPSTKASLTKPATTVLLTTVAYFAARASAHDSGVA